MGVRGGNTTLFVPPRNASYSNTLKSAPLVVCYRQRSISRSLWQREDPLESVFSIILLQVFFTFFLSRSIYWLLRPLKQPQIVCNVLAGIILGPSVLGHSQKFRALLFGAEGNYLINVMSIIGLIYFVFITAVKLDASMIFRTARSTWRIAVAGFVFAFFTVFSLCYTLKMKFKGRQGGYISLYAASFISFTYFIVIAHALNELNLITSELGQLALSLSMIYDASHIVVSVVLSTIRQDTMMQASGMVVSLIALIAFTIYVIRPGMIMMIKKTPRGKPVREVYILAIFAAVAIMSILSDMIGLTVIHGAVLLGLAIPDGPPLGSTLTEKAESLVSQVFLPFVFVHVGYETDIYSIKNWKHFFGFQLVITASYCAMLIGVLLAAIYSKIKLKNAILLSLIMNLRGILELFVYHKLLQVQFIDSQEFTQLVLSALFLTMTVTPVIEIYYKPQMRLSKNSSIIQKGIRSIRDLWNDSEFRIISCVHTQDNVHSIITFLERTNPTEASPLSVYAIHLVELVGRAVPLLVKHKKHKKRSNSMNSANSEQIMRAFENFSSNSQGPVTVNPFVMIAPYKSMHECICRFAQDNLIPFIVIPFHENQRFVAENQPIASMRHFNTRLQAFAPCTVGILVDRSFAGNVSCTNLSYSIAIIFIGGDDDREALALAARMSCHSAVSITVLHFIMHGDGKRRYEEEMKVDEFLMDEFKLKNQRDPAVVVKEILVDDRVKVIDSLLSIKDNYNLMIVGRRQGNVLTTDEEMSGFVENAELGVIGDMLASSDICGGEASVLVMNHACYVDGDSHVASTEDSERTWMVSEFQRFNGG